MKIRHLILILLLMVGMARSAKADPYFPYPIVPDSITTFQGRCDYLSEHFWDFCDLTKAFSARAKMAEEFKVYLTIMANASSDKAVASVTELMKKLEKQPKDQLYLATVAEGEIYADTARMWIDDLYLPIVSAVASNKRIDKASKARFAHQAKILQGARTGQPAPSLAYTRPDGTTSNLDSDSATVAVVVFFNDPDCSDCSLARIRLDADISMTQLIEEGKVKVVSISLTEPDDAWREAVAEYPSSWTVGAAPDADLVYDLRFGTPDFYVLDKKHRIHFKHLDINQLLDVTRQLKKR